VAAAVLLFGSVNAEGRIEVPESATEKSFATNIARIRERFHGQALLAELLNAAEKAEVVIEIVPITDDPSTWKHQKERGISHTEPKDGEPKKKGRTTPTASTIFLFPKEVSNSKNLSGTLAHELVHAVDLAYGRYDPSSVVREKRAVFFQNLWRDHFGYRLRRAYNDSFTTLEYQAAKQRGDVEKMARGILSSAGIAAP
jgi:hypothetical protein